MITQVLDILKIINKDYADLCLTIVAIISAIVAYREYFLKHRPYILSEIVFEQIDNNWYFHVMLINKGEYPAIIKISKAILIIGDEEYPTVFNHEIVLSPGEKQKLAPIGHINENGRNKIIGHEYRNNRVEILISIDSKAINQKKFKHQTNIEYEVQVNNNNPIIKIIKEEIS